jgi:hypothetical protein
MKSLLVEGVEHNCASPPVKGIGPGGVLLYIDIFSCKVWHLDGCASRSEFKACRATVASDDTDRSHSNDVTIRSLLIAL